MKQEQATIIRKDLSKLSVKPNLTDYVKTYKDFSWEKVEKELGFFADGKMNAAYTAIDRHAEGAKKNKVALHYQSAAGQKEKYTYADLKKLSDQFANVLEAQEIEKGDRVFIFLPCVPERYVAFLGILK